jgi:hypothetical protein
MIDSPEDPFSAKDLITLTITPEDRELFELTERGMHRITFLSLCRDFGQFHSALQPLFNAASAIHLKSLTRHQDEFNEIDIQVTQKLIQQIGKDITQGKYNFADDPNVIPLTTTVIEDKYKENDEFFYLAMQLDKLARIITDITLEHYIRYHHHNHIQTAFQAVTEQFDVAPELITQFDDWLQPVLEVNAHASQFGPLKSVVGSHMDAEYVFDQFASVERQPLPKDLESLCQNLFRVGVTEEWHDDLPTRLGLPKPGKTRSESNSRDDTFNELTDYFTARMMGMDEYLGVQKATQETDSRDPTLRDFVDNTSTSPRGRFLKLHLAGCYTRDYFTFLKAVSEIMPSDYAWKVVRRSKLDPPTVIDGKFITIYPLYDHNNSAPDPINQTNWHNTLDLAAKLDQSFSVAKLTIPAQAIPKSNLGVGDSNRVSFRFAQDKQSFMHAGHQDDGWTNDRNRSFLANLPNPQVWENLQQALEEHKLTHIKPSQSTN